MASKRKFEDEPNLSKDSKRGRVEKNSKEPSTAKRRRVDQEKSLQSANAKDAQLSTRLEDERTSEEGTPIGTNKLSTQLENEKKAKGDTHISQESANDKNVQLSKQLENERKAKEETLISLESANAKNTKLSTQLENERKAKEEALMSLQSAKAENTKLSTQLENERKAKEEALMSLKSANAKNTKLSTQLENERKAKEEALMSLQSASAKNAHLSKQLENERKIKEDALIRLSSLASNMLRDNNPNIADLSDPHRPTKLSEQFSELYDNEWTDAFDELQKISVDKEDKEIISYLLQFLLEINSVCSSLSASKLNEIQRQFVLPAEPSDENKVHPELFKTIKDEIKSTASKYLKDVKVHVHNHLKQWLPWKSLESCMDSGNVKRYIDKCTDVCWYMSVQDPQLFMEGDQRPGDKFDSSKYREYTKKGPYEEFIVWPVLYLYRGGPMLSKGVAQGSTLKEKKVERTDM